MADEPTPAPTPTTPAPTPAPSEGGGGTPTGEPSSLIGDGPEGGKPEPSATPSSLIGAEPGKGGEPKTPAEPPKPIEYTAFKLPDGVELEAEGLKEAHTLFNELRIPQEGAQKLVDFYVKNLRAEAEAPYQLWSETQKKWEAETLADPQIGGDKFPAVKTRISKLFDTFGAEGVREALTLTGAGNHPAIIKTFAKIAEKLVEGSFVPAGSGPATPKTAAEIFYPGMKG